MSIFRLLLTFFVAIVLFLLGMRNKQKSLIIIAIVALMIGLLQVYLIFFIHHH